MTEQDRTRIEECYIEYCEVVKPLMARIEALSEKMPLALFNEVRAFNDHIARCYYNHPSDEYVSHQIDKATRHILRMTLDCFKCLIVVLYEQVSLFERQTRNIDLTVIDNGLFYPEYSRIKEEGAKCVKEAKMREAENPESALPDFEKACNLYSDLVDRILQVAENVKWARVRFSVKRGLTVLAWITSIIVSAIISALFTCELFSDFFSRWI